MRLLAILFWVTVAVLVLRAFRRRFTPSPPRARVPVRDELVKDPVCQTYVVKSRAVRRASGGEERYFCSDECARRASRV